MPRPWPASATTRDWPATSKSSTPTMSCSTSSCCWRKHSAPSSGRAPGCIDRWAEDGSRRSCRSREEAEPMGKDKQEKQQKQKKKEKLSGKAYAKELSKLQ